MGGGGSSPKGYPVRFNLNYIKDLSISFETFETILGLRPGETYNLSFIGSEIPLLKSIFPEHSFNDLENNLYTVQRDTYYGDNAYCCLNEDIYYKYDGKFYTCNPVTKLPGNTRSCDSSLYNYCFGANPNLTICNAWLDGYIREVGYDSKIIEAYNYCTLFDKPFCNRYLTVMRNNPDPNIHDAFIEQYKDSTFKCSYPLNITLKRAQHINEERICWDPNCIASPLWKLKYADYIKRLNCKIVQTEINLTLTDPTFINAITITDDPVAKQNNYIPIAASENIYTSPLKKVGRIEIDFLSVKHLLIITGFIMLISLYD